MKKLVMMLALVLVTIAARAEMKPYPTETVQGRLCYVYHAEKSIGLYRISVNFGCSQEDILHFNPELRTRGLRLDEKLYIPVSSEDIQSAKAAAKAEKNAKKSKDAHQAEEPKAEVAVEAKAEEPKVEPKAEEPTQAPAEETIAEEATAEESAEPTAVLPEIPSDGKLRIGLLMPLYAHETERSPSIEKFLDFYEGVLIATYELQEQGLPIELHVHDVEKSDAMVSELIRNHQLRGLNGILGPAYPSQVNTLAAYVAEQHIPTLVPMADKIAQIESNPYLIQFNVNPEDEARVMADYLAQDTLINVVLVQAARESDIPESIRQMRSAIREAGVHTTSTTIHDILSDSLCNALVPGMENILLLNSERYSNISVLMPKILRAQEGYRLVLLSQYTWQKENIDMPQIYLTEFATDAPTDQIQYDELYERYFRHEHSTSDPRYDLLGYDLMHALVAQLRGQEYEGLQSGFEWERIENGGIKNTRLTVVRK